MTPAATTTKANSVPTLTISSSFSIGKNAATTATATPTMIWMRAGVPNLLVFDSERGRSPSRAIANNTRDWPSINTITTVVSPARAPIEIAFSAQVTPFCPNAYARFFGSPSPVDVASSL